MGLAVYVSSDKIQTSLDAGMRVVHPAEPRPTEPANIATPDTTLILLRLFASTAFAAALFFVVGLAEPMVTALGPRIRRTPIQPLNLHP
jgi:hypothetical protein